MRLLRPWKNLVQQNTIWNHFYDPKQNIFYKHHDRKYGSWTFLTPFSTIKYVFNSSPGMPKIPPETLHRINLESYTDNLWIYCTLTSTKTETRNITFTNTTFNHYSKISSTRHKSPLLHKIQIPSEAIHQYKKQIKYHETRTAIDGSVLKIV